MDRGNENQHDIPGILPGVDNRHGPDDRMGKTKKRCLEEFDRVGGTHAHQNVVQDELPDVAQHNPADQRGNKETGTVKIPSFDLAGYNQGQNETHHVDQYNVDQRISDCNEKGVYKVGRARKVAEVP